ncbi:hypothetical protein PMAYCL1PPCAC_31867, partial [Pristionchus mayeri]
FRLTALVLLLAVLGVSIGMLVVSLNIRDDVDATTDATTTTKSLPPVPSTTTAPPPCTTLPTVPPKTEEPKTEGPPVDPVDPDAKNIPDAQIIDKDDRRYSSFAGISNLYEKWMDLTVNPCNDFYHYVCGKGQKNDEYSPFAISQERNDQVASKMWQANADYWKNAPLPVKQAKWIHDKCSTDSSYTVADQEAKIKEMLEQFLDSTDVDVPFFTLSPDFTMNTTDFSQLLGYTKGQFGAVSFLPTRITTDFKNPDVSAIYVDQPLPLFKAEAYGNLYPVMKNRILGNKLNLISLKVLAIYLPKQASLFVQKMAGDVVEFDKDISLKMQQDPIVRRQVERNYKPHTLDDLNTKADQFEWVTYIQSVLTLLGDKANVDNTWKVIIMEEDITFNLLNNHIKEGNRATVANYVFLRAFSQILSSVPEPRAAVKKPSEMDQYRAVLSNDKRTLIDMLRKPPVLDKKLNE